MQHSNKTRGAGPLGGAGMVGLWGASSLIRSVQYGSVGLTTTSGTATIAAVNVDNSAIILTGVFASNNGTNNAANDVVNKQVVLTNSTTVTVTSTAAPPGNTDTIKFVVVEFAPGVLRSRQVISMTASPTTITEVNTAKTLLVYNGALGSFFPNIDLVVNPNFTLASSTSVTFTVGVGGYYSVYGRLTVLEFF